MGVQMVNLKKHGLPITTQVACFVLFVSAIKPVLNSYIVV